MNQLELFYLKRIKILLILLEYTNIWLFYGREKSFK